MSEKKEEWINHTDDGIFDAVFYFTPYSQEEEQKGCRRKYVYKMQMADLIHRFVF